MNQDWRDFPGAAPAFLQRGGGMGARMRVFDWADTPMGAPAGWPPALQTLVSLLLSSSQPMFVCWGAGLSCIYNDALVPILADKHPQALGRSASLVWQESWPQLQPLFERVFKGQAVDMQSSSVLLHRHGKLEPAYFDFSYTPVFGSGSRSAHVDGLFCVCAETTHQVQPRLTEGAIQRDALLVALQDHIRDNDDPGEISFGAAELLGRALKVSRAGYGTIHKSSETIVIERDWNAPGIQSLAGTLHFRDYGSYIDDLKAGVTVAVSDAYEDPRTAATPDALKGISAQALVNMPVTEQGDLVALLYLNHAEARHWSHEELRLIREVAERTRVAVERRRAEEQLRVFAATLERQVAERTQERDLVWRNSRDILIVIGADGIFRAVSPAWTQTLGHPVDQVVGHSHLQFIAPEDAVRSQGGLDSAVGQNDLTNFENRYLHADGGTRWLSWQTSVEGGLVFGIGRDVTEQKLAQAQLLQTQEALRQSQKMEAVGQLTGGIAHDFNNLLAAISGSLELLARRIADGRIGGSERYVGIARGAARRAAALTQRLLAFSRRQTLDPRPTDVNKLIAGMEELVRRSVGPTVELEVVGAGGLWLCKIDASQLENALLNLCLNARDAMAPGGGGRLTIETANKWLDERGARGRDLQPGQYISVCVSDTGIGMTPDVVERAFDPFFTTKPMGEGTGLGLSMVYGFVRQSGGQVRIYSEPGKGTTMCLYLLRHVGGADAPDEVPSQAIDPGDGETVLVVEDEASIRMLLVEVLQDNGYAVIEAADGPSGVRTLQSDARIDLLITDVGLPGGMNGRQVAEAGRAIRPGLKVLFITGFAENAAWGNGHLDKSMAVLTKPFDMSALANKARDLIDGK